MRIIIRSGAAAGREFDVPRQMTVGRSASCDIQLPDAGISSRHATVRPISGGLEVADLGSLNGTFVNGVQVHGARAVYAGDELRFSLVAAAVADVAVAPAYAAGPSLPGPVGAGGGRKPQRAVLVGGIAAVVLVAAAFGLAKGLSGGKSTPATPSTSTASAQTPRPAPTSPPPPNPTQPPAPNPTQAPAPNPSPTSPPSRGGDAQAVLQRLSTGTARLPGGSAQPTVFTPGDDEVAAKAIGLVGVVFTNADGSREGAYWTVYPSPADAQGYLAGANGSPAKSGDPNVQFKCDTGKSTSGNALAWCYGLRAGSEVIVYGFMALPSGNPDSSIASAYATSGLQYAAAMER